MLTLRRLQGEEIYIGDDIVITVVGQRGGETWIGVTAPKSVKVLRDDVAPPDHPLLADRPRRTSAPLRKKEKPTDEAR